MDLIPHNNNNEITMSSLEIVELINQERKAQADRNPGQKWIELRHDTFMAKVPKVLGENHAPKFSGTQKYGNNNTRAIYNLPQREAFLMVMSESYELQAKLYDRYQALQKKVGQSAKEIENKYFHLMDQRLSTMEGLLSNITALVNNLAIQQTPPQPPTDDPSNYFRVVEYGELFYSHIPKSTHMDNAKAMGGMVASISKKLGYKVVQVQNGKYPANTYHKNALKEAYAKFYN